jgi:hypothetical protein
MEWSDWLNVVIVASAILAGCAGLYIVSRRYVFGGSGRSRADPASSQFEARVARDWMTTGRIDFAGVWEKIGDEHTPHELYVRVEETRVTDNVGGGFNIDRRWRRATLNEARQIVVRYHQFLDEHPDHARVGDPLKMDSPAFDGSQKSDR